jgi:hypothetical protein
MDSRRQEGSATPTPLQPRLAARRMAMPALLVLPWLLFDSQIQGVHEKSMVGNGDWIVGVLLKHAAPSEGHFLALNFLDRETPPTNRCSTGKDQLAELSQWVWIKR